MLRLRYLTLILIGYSVSTPSLGAGGAGAEVLDLSARHLKRMESINDRYNRASNEAASKFSSAMSAYLAGRGKYPSTLSRQFFKLEQQRREEITQATSEFSQSKNKALSEVGKRRRLASVARVRGEGPVEPTRISGSRGGAPARAAPKSAPARDIEVIDGSQVPKEIDFSSDGPARAAPPAAPAGAAPREGVGEVSF